MAELKFPVFQQVWATRRRQDNTACLSSIVVPLVIAWVTHELTWNYEITRYVTGHEVYHKLFFHSIPLTSLRDSTDKYLKIGHLLFHRNSKLKFEIPLYFPKKIFRALDISRILCVWIQPSIFLFLSTPDIWIFTTIGPKNKSVIVQRIKDGSSLYCFDDLHKFIHITY